MRTNSAKLHSPETRRILQLVYPGVTLLDVTGPAQVFGSAGEITPDGALKKSTTNYEITVVSLNGGPVETDVGVSLDTAAISEVSITGIDTLLVSGGIGVLDAALDERMVDWFRQASHGSRRVGSTCMGAFLLAASGLADGQSVTTHWRWANELQKRYPNVKVESERIFVRSEGIWSSAGVTSGIDMTLAMIADDLGHKVSIQVAKAILVYVRRPGNQEQYSSRLQAQMNDEAGKFDVLHEWIEANLASDLSTERLAAQQGMSIRNFARVYSQSTGQTPAKAIERMRVEAAKNVLVRKGSSVSNAARTTGFGCEKSMRRAFQRVIEMTPSEFKIRFEECTMV